MRLFHCTLTQTVKCLAGSRARWWLRTITSLIVTLCLLLPAFPLPGQTFSGAGRQAVPAPSLSRPLDTAVYAASLFLLYPDMALAQGGVISKTAPAFARPGDTISYPLVIEKTTLTDWLTGTVVVTDTVPFNTGGPSGAPEPAWSYTFSGGVGRFQNNTIIAGTGVISVAVFNVVVDPLVTNGTFITNTAHFSDSLGTAVSPVVTTTIQAPEFSLLKSASSSPVCAGSLLTYTLVVSNANLDGSPAGVINVPYTQVDRLPAGVSLISASDSPVTSADTITWTMSSPLDSLWGAGFNAVTRTAVVSVPYSLNNGFTLTNRVTVSHATVPSATFVLPITVSKVTPNFTTNSPVAFGASAVFTNTTLGDATFAWDFGDGVTSTLTNPSHIYASGGVFTPTLAAASIYGCGVLTVSQPLTVVTPATLTVTANPTNTYANGISHTLVTAVVSDTFGSPIAGQPLTFTTSLGHWAGDGQTIGLSTNGLGIATNTLTSTVAGTAYITVTAPNGISGTVQVIFDLPTLALTKFDDPDPVQAGSVLTYSLVYTNESNVTALNPWITDTLPASVTLLTSTPSTTTQNANVVGWNVDSLAPYSSDRITMTVLVNSPIVSGTIITNSAIITAPAALTETTALVTTTIRSSHTLTVAKSDTPDPVGAGATLDYTLAYTVTGNEPALDAVITDAVPANTVFGSAAGGVTPVGGVLTWNLGQLSPPDSGVLTYTVTVNSPLPNGTILTNSVSFSDDSGQVATDTITTTVVSSHTLFLVKSDLPDPVDAGGTLTYTLIYSVTGNEPATSVTITDTIPANTGYDSCAGCTQSGGVITWTLGDLNPGVAGALTLTVMVDTPLPNDTVITNTAHLFDANGGPPVSATVTTTVASSHTLHLIKNDLPDPVDAGGTLTYTLAYSVTGNEMAQAVAITDTVPANTTFAGASGGMTSVGGVVTWPLGNLLPGSDGTLTMTVVVTSPLANGTVLTNTGTIFDINGGLPVSSTVTTTVVSTHTLNLLKSDFPDPVDAGAVLTYTLAYSLTGNESAQSVLVTDTVPVNTTYNLCSGGVTCGEAGGVVTWDLGSLNAGDSGVLTLTVAVDIPLPNGTVLTNTGHLVDGNGGVPALSTITTTVASTSDITFTKIANPPASSQVAPGDTLIYTLVAANTGSQLATGVLLTDTLPAEVNVVNATGSRAPAPVVAGNLVTWNIGTLTVNETVTATLEVTVTTPLTSGTVIANVGELFTAQTGISTTNTVTHSVLSTPILTLHKSAQPPPGSGVSPGQTITYTIAVTNSGNGPATNFQITDTVPVSTNLVGVSATPPGFSTMAGTNAITIGGTLNAGQSMAATFVVTVALGVTDGTILANTGYVSYAESPVISATNTVTHVVQSTPVISISKLAQPPGPTIGAGEAITYSVVVSNNGGFDAANVVLTDAIPTNTHYVAGSANSTLGTVTEADPLRVDLPSLAAGQSMTFTFQITVTTPITNGTIINNAAYVSANFLPPVESNTVTHTVVATPSLTVSKAASPPGGSEVDPGDAILYFIRVRNDGSANVNNLTITETIPISTEYVLSQRIPPVGVETIGDPLVWTIPSLAGNGGQVEYRVVVTVTDTAPPGLLIPNTAQISSDQTPLTTTNVVTHQLRQTPSLTISKTADPLPGSGLLPGDPITYTVRLTNTGSTTLTNVMLVDLLDGNTTLVSSTATPPALLLGSSAMWLVLAPNAGVSLELQTVVTSTVPGGTIITNVATGSSAQTAVVASPPVTHVVESIPNLILAKTADPLSGSTLNPGDPITYTLWVSNSGTAAATGVVITDMLDANLNLVSVTPAASSTNPLVLDAGTLAAGGGSANFTVLVTVTTSLTNGYVINNQAQVTSVEVPTATLSNLVTHTVVATPNLVINKYATPLPGSIVDPGDGINYFVEIINTGNAPVSNLTITDVLPISTTFFSAQLIPPLGTITGFDPVVAQIPTLAGNGGAVQLRFSVNVADTAPTGLIIPNVAQVVSDQTALTSTNTITHQVREAAGLNIVKTADPAAGSSVQPGDTITYTLIVNNTGAGDAYEMTLTDVLPAGVSYVAGSVNTSPGFSVSSIAPDMVVTGTLATGSSMTATLQVTVSTTVSGTILTNTAQATATNASLVTTAITHAVVVPAYNVLISKNATPPSGSVVEPGDLITYTVTVANTGDPVNNVVISDTLDTFVTLAGNNSTHGIVTGPNPLLVSGFGLSTGEIAVLTLTVQVNGVVSGTVIDNRASVTATELAALQTSGLITHVISNTIPVPSLAITKAATPPSGGSVGPNSPITYTVVVENNGSGPANNVSITDTLPAEVNLVSVNLSGPGAVGSSNPLTASIATLDAGDRITLTVGVTTSTVATDTVITNVAQTSANAVAVQVSPPVTHLLTTIPPVPAPNLIINKSAIPGSGSVVEPGDTITYTIAAQNTGAGAATGVVISDTLDPNVSLVSSSTTAGVVGAGNPVQVTGFGLTPGAGVTVTLVVTVSGTTSGTVINNRADVSSSQVVTPQLSGSVTHLISNSVTVPPIFTVVKSANPAAGTPVHLNDLIQYTIVVQNSGGPASNVALTDTIPANTTLVNGSAATTPGSVTESPTQVVANVAGFPAGGTMTTTFQVRVATSSTVNITNLAALDSDQTTPQNSNSVVHPVQASPGGGNNVYLPIILKNFSSSYLSLHWDNVEPVRDRVTPADGAAGVCFSFPCDGQNDGVFRLRVNIGSEGPKVVSNVRLVSSQGIEWNTIPGDGLSTLGLFNGGPLNSSLDGSVSGVLFNSGQVELLMFAADGTPARFLPGQYLFTVIVNFSDGSSLSAQTMTF